MDIYLDRTIESLMKEGYGPVGMASNAIQLPAEVSEELVLGALRMTNPDTLSYDAVVVYKVNKPIYEHPEMASEKPAAEKVDSEIMIAIGLMRNTEN